MSFYIKSSIPILHECAYLASNCKDVTREINSWHAFFRSHSQYQYRRIHQQPYLNTLHSNGHMHTAMQSDES